MKNLPYVLNGILFVAIIILYILFFKSNKASDVDNSVKFSGDSSAVIPVAYVNIDSVLVNYNFAKDVSANMEKKMNSSRSTLESKQKGLMAEEKEFQQKYQNNGFLNQERAQQEYQRLQKLGADLQQMAVKMDQDLNVEQHKINKQVEDSVRQIITIYNQKANYHIVLSTTSGLGNILYAQEKYDITNPVLTLLNSRYQTPAK